VHHRAGDDPVVEREAVCPAVERDRRLVADLGRERRDDCGGDVGRIRRDKIEPLVCDRPPQIADADVDAIGDGVALGVSASERGGIRRDLGGDDLRRGELARERDRDDAGAGAQIEDGTRRGPVRPVRARV
jgi:hypothetical protein